MRRSLPDTMAMLLSVAVQIPTWAKFQYKSSDLRSTLTRVTSRTMETMHTLLRLVLAMKSVSDRYERVSYKPPSMKIPIKLTF